MTRYYNDREIELKRLLEEEVGTLADLPDNLSQFKAGCVGEDVAHTDFYRSIGAMQRVVDYVQHGYVPDFASFPPPMQELKNNKSAENNYTFVKSEIERMLKAGVLEEVPHPPHIINPLSAVLSNKWRLVWDCYYLNDHLKRKGVVLDTLDDMIEVIEEHDFCSTSDLMAGYHQVKIRLSSRKFYGCHIWDREQQRYRYFQSKVLVLGEANMVAVFKDLILPIVKEARKYMDVIFYVDDFFSRGRTEEDCRKNTRLLHRLLRRGGWVLNPEKTTTPATVCKFLGLLVNTETERFTIPAGKLERLVDKGHQLLNKQKFSSVRDLASFLGLLQSCSRAIAIRINFRTRSLHKAIEFSRSQRGGWKSPAILSREAQDEVNFWLNLLPKNEGARYRKDPTITPTKVALAGDGSVNNTCDDDIVGVSF